MQTPQLTHTGVKPAAFQTICAVELDGVHTDIVLHRFANRTCLMITQFGRIGNVYLVYKNSNVSGTMRSSKEVEYCFGTDSDECMSAIGYLVNNVPALGDAPEDVVLTLSLRKIDVVTIRQLEATLKELL